MRRSPWTLFIETSLTSTKYSAADTTLVTFTIFFQTFCFLAFTTFFYLFVLDTKTEDLCFSFSLGFYLDLLFLFLLLFETMRDGVSVPSECFYDGFFMFFNIIKMVPAAVTVAVLTTEHLFLEALTVKFETS